MVDKWRQQFNKCEITPQESARVLGQLVPRQMLREWVPEEYQPVSFISIISVFLPDLIRQHIYEQREIVKRVDASLAGRYVHSDTAFVRDSFPDELAELGEALFRLADRGVEALTAAQTALIIGQKDRKGLLHDAESHLMCMHADMDILDALNPVPDELTPDETHAIRVDQLFLIAQLKTTVQQVAGLLERHQGRSR